MPPLKLIALDKEDLEIVSAQLQDSVLRVADMTYQPRARRFVLILNRFDWANALESGSDRKGPFMRHRAALRFENVSAVQSQLIAGDARDKVLSLLAIRFEEAEPPSGTILLIFAAGAGIRLRVDCVEVELRDLGASWTTASQPHHDMEADFSPPPRGKSLINKE
jgi:hypothetical protein